MRLLRLDKDGELSLTSDLLDDIPPYAILSHTWGGDKEEVTFNDVENGRGQDKEGYKKIEFCGQQARKDKLEHFWVDTCCIDKTNHAELSEAMNSMFRWYRDAVKCYVYLPDVLALQSDTKQNSLAWEPNFRNSRWFKRGWTLQELLAPKSVEVFSRDGQLLGSKKSLDRLVHEITNIPIFALRGAPLTDFQVDERLRWRTGRSTKNIEDQAYCLLGIFGVFLPLIYGERENAVKRLKAEINRLQLEEKYNQSEPSKSAVPTHVHWVVTRAPNPLFTGRSDILHDLEHKVRDAAGSCWDQAQCRIVITGIGGQGKSEICLQLAHRLRQIFWGVFWIDISTSSDAQAAFLDLAHKLALPAQTWQEACVAIANLKYPWLLVLDNADDPNVDCQQYIPNGSHGVVMLTSRNDECQQYATQSIALEGLADEKARELLLKATRISLDQHSVLEGDASRAARLLQSHPLALIQAGAYISRGHCTLAQYPQVYERQRRRLLEFRPAQAQSRYRDVYATFEASADVLKNTETEAGRNALVLLPMLAACGPSRLPLLLFKAAWNGAKGAPPDVEDDTEDENMLLLTAWHVARLPSLLGVMENEWDSYRMIEAVHLLKAFALVTTDNSGDFVNVSMHPLVHAWARDRQSDIEQHDSWLRMGCLVALSSRDGAFWGAHERQLQTHVEALMEWKVETMFAAERHVLVARAIANCGWLLHQTRSDGKLFVLLKNTFNYLRLDRRRVEKQWMGLYELKARNLVNQGQIEEAIQVIRQLMKIQEQTLAENHPDRLASQHALAGVYEANGQVKEAVEMLEKVVKIKEQTLAESHPSRLASQHALAGVYEANGQVKEAVEMLEKVVKIEEQTLAENHPSRLASQHNLAIYIWQLGELQAARDMIAQVVSIGKKVLDKTHQIRQSAEEWLRQMDEDMATINLS